MAVVSGFIGDDAFDRVTGDIVPEKLKLLLAQALCCNINDGRLVKDDVVGDLGMSAVVPSSFKFVGSTTECAMLVMASKFGFGYESLQRENPKVYRWNFSSSRKRMSTLIKLGEGTGFRLLCKGASEMILQRCTKVIHRDGSVVDITKAQSDNYGEQISKLASKGLRTICLAYRDFADEKTWKNGGDDGEGFEEGLTLIAALGIEDPLRPDVPEAVKSCQRAGIVVRMVTGDNILTAKKIAEDCNIYDPAHGVAWEGPEFSAMTDEEALKDIDNLQILARSKPNDKHRLVTLLRERGRVVAVTGDGTNDGPALRFA